MKEKFKRWFTFRPWQRHGLVLMISGLVYIAFGFALALHGELSDRRALALVIALRMFDLVVWGDIFILAGLLAVLSSRWPEFSNSWGYAVLTGLASAWSGIYLFGYILGGATRLNVASGLIWGLVAFLWWAISGLVNPDETERHCHGCN